MSVNNPKRALPLLFFLLAGCAATPTQSQMQEASITFNSDGTLVAYFSVTGHTKKIASTTSELLSCDLFEIIPEEPYAAEDIDYGKDCRANREQDNPNARPLIASTVADMGQYDTIVLGYPIWWGEAPKTLYTFMESYDFDGKTILPFCTSGSSPIGGSARNLSASAPNARWLEGKRFDAGAGKEEIGKWLEESFKENDMKLWIDEKQFQVKWEDNEAVAALKERTPVTIATHEFGGFEQTGSLGFSLPRNDSRIDVSPGDIVLFEGDAISIFYRKSSWTYTRLGHIEGSATELDAALKKPSANITIKGA